MEEKILFNQLQTLTIEPGNGADFVLICGCPCAGSLYNVQMSSLFCTIYLYCVKFYLYFVNVYLYFVNFYLYYGRRP